MTYLDRLKNIDLRNSTANDVRDILKNLSILCVPLLIKEGTYILRARKGGGFTCGKEMTYCPVEYCTSLQRATLPGNSMFYGVISDDQNHLDHARAIATGECSTLGRKGISSKGRETFTIAHWEVMKPLHVVSFVTPSTFIDSQENSLLHLLRNAFVQIHGGEESTKLEKDTAEFISHEFSKFVSNNENYKYLISATLSTDIIKEHNLDGIIYPSVQLLGQGGLNIALTTSAADEKLKFIRTLDQTLYKNGGKSCIRIESVTENCITRDIQQYSDTIIKSKLKINDLTDIPIF